RVPTSAWTQSTATHLELSHLLSTSWRAAPRCASARAVSSRAPTDRSSSARGTSARILFLCGSTRWARRVSNTSFATPAQSAAAPATAGPARCGAPSPLAHFTIGADGTGRAVLVVRGGRVGSEGAECGRDTPCGIVVQEDASIVPAPVAPVTFAAGPSARYES